ncbi:MAG: hypothetical protein JWR50_1705 [Mucilaginibacter sp.]|nr:hypothetical protein [Mucilaginibacter sp.]
MAYNTPLQPLCPSRPLSRGELCRSCSLAFLFLLCVVTLLPSCKPDAIQDSAPNYFDLKGYFNKEILRLSKHNHPVLKTVTHNDISETKKVNISKWDLELNLFIQSDINKPAWRDSYTVQNTGNAIFYRAKTPDLKTRLIVVNKKDNKIKWILIYNSTKNILYQTTEKLSYFPDSVYIIQKYQKVRLLGANNYVIKGTLN